MADLVLSARVTLQKTSLIPADAVVNTFTIQADDATVDYAAIVAALANFYDTAAAGAADAVDRYFGSSIERVGAPHTIDLYDITAHLDGSPVLAPAVYSSSIGITHAFAGSPDLPAECAVCLTMFGAGRGSAPVAVGTTRPKQRRTGRVFLGPYCAEAMATVAGETRVDAAVMNDLGAAAKALQVELVTTDHFLVVWSRADAAVYVVDSGYVDNAWDTIRSRGPTATNRDSWSVI